jgi:transposase
MGQKQVDSTTDIVRREETALTGLLCQYGHGRYRRAMEGVGTAVAGIQETGWTWPAVARRTCGAQWHSLDSTHRCTVEGPAQAISSLSNLPSTLSAMAAKGSIGCDFAAVIAGLSRPRDGGLGGGADRRFLQRSEKGGFAVGTTKCGKGSKIMAIADGHGLPVALYVASASPHETQLVEPTLQSCFAPRLPQRLIGDLAYDSDPLDEELRQNHGVELVAPHKINRSKPKTQDGRVLRRRRRRWKIERLFAWLQNFRRVVTRWEYHDDNFFGMVQLACILILLKRYL